jgi:hypothetical protein
MDQVDIPINGDRLYIGRDRNRSAIWVFSGNPFLHVSDLLPAFRIYHGIGQRALRRVAACRDLRLLRQGSGVDE